MTRLLLILCLSTPLTAPIASQGRPMTVHDMMAFRQIKGAKINPSGQWVAYEARPDRGDGSGWVVSTDGKTRREVKRGRKPVFSEDGKWVAFTIAPPFEEMEKAKKDKKPKPGAALMNLASGHVETYERVSKFAFSRTGNALVIEHYPADDGKKNKSGDAPTERRLKLLKLSPQRYEEGYHYATSWALDPKGGWLVAALGDDKQSALIARDLYAFGPGVSTLAERRLLTPLLGDARIANPTFSKDGSRLAWLVAPVTDGKPGPATIWTWDGKGEPAAVEGVKATIPIDAPLEWSPDGARLFFGTRAPTEEPKPATDDAVAKLLDKRTLDVWHADDPFISPHQKKRWKTEKKRTLLAVLHIDDGTVVQLADDALPDVTVPKNARVALATSDVPYRKARTWDLPRRDVYTVDLKTGEQARVTIGARSGATLSPKGGFVAWYDDGHWYLWDTAKKRSRCLTADLGVPFANETHDYPYPAPGYGRAQFEDDDSTVYIYDRYDVWCFPTDGGAPQCLTKGEGRKTRTTSRLVTLDPEGESMAERTGWLATTYSDETKAWGIGRVGEKPLLAGAHKYRVLGHAKETGRILYTRESYREFPDLWVVGYDGKEPVKLTDLGRQTDGIAWGRAELVHWKSTTGEPLDGVVIRPDNYQRGGRYPVVVYFYRKFSQRLHEFNEVVVNHRPCFPYYASNGYVVFLPDVNFEIGAPGPSATRCLVPGIEKLVELGIADPERIGLHGHSWSGYQTAFVITETNAFRTAVAGAPVSNMTSAYGGIRWQTGLSRQFQYERTQSRIGGSLWEARERYIANSPVFLADRIKTPLLIQFGDEDGAVPWYQGIELYMAMRRLDKPCVFLQYRGEGHHLKQYPNKLDYTLKMKAWFDHYLKDAPAPTWITAGQPYRGK